MTKIAIVTGASRGFGRGTARILASEAGYKVYATARTESALHSLQKEVAESNTAGEVIPVVLDAVDRILKPSGMKMNSEQKEN